MGSGGSTFVRLTRDSDVTKVHACYVATMSGFGVYPFLVVPVHPLFSAGRLQAICRMYGRFPLKRFALSVVSLTGTAQTGFTAVTQKPLCEPISSTDPWGDIAATGAEVRPAWMPFRFVVDCFDSSSWNPVIPKSPEDVPASAFIYTDAGDVRTTFLVLCEVEVDFRDEVYVTDLSMVGLNRTEITGFGFTYDTEKGGVGICVNSTCSNVDLGELIVQPACPESGVITTGPAPLHNTRPLDMDTPADQGIIDMIFAELD